MHSAKPGARADTDGKQKGQINQQDTGRGPYYVWTRLPFRLSPLSPPLPPPPPPPLGDVAFGRWRTQRATAVYRSSAQETAVSGRKGGNPERRGGGGGGRSEPRPPHVTASWPKFWRQIFTAKVAFPAKKILCVCVCVSCVLYCVPCHSVQFWAVSR